MIRFRDITLRRGRDALLQQASATLYPGQRTGLVGPNGCGKSSLFGLMLGELSLDAGEMELPGEWRIAHMAQSFTDLERPALEAVMDGDGELRAAEGAVAQSHADGDGEAIGHAHMRLENAGGYTARARAGELLNGLGFAPEQHEQPVGAFSGGWRVRLQLARALMCPADLLLLDEPTNHLDLEAVLWLEDWLRQFAGTLVLISHDRDFLDAICNQILHIEHSQLHTYSGNYSEFERLRAQHLAHQQALHLRQQREIAHMQRFIDRFRAKATKARAAQSRVKALQRMEMIAPAHADSPFDFTFTPPDRVAYPVLKLDNVSLGYGETTVLSEINLDLAPGDRIGLLGLNGAGKSTLVRALAGELKPQAGQIEINPATRTGYFAQHQLEQLEAAASPLAHLQALAGKTREQGLRDFLGGFAFHGEMATAPVGPLSGGEKARLVLALLVWQKPNLLLLDEPTNHLDLEMRHALTVALQDFEGAVVVVSHDRHLLNSTVERYWLVADKQARPFEGDLDDYRQWLIGGGAAQNGKTGAARPTANSKRANRQQAAARRELQRRSEKLMRKLEKTETELAEVETELAQPELYTKPAPEKLAQLQQRQTQLKAQKSALEADWMVAEEELETTGQPET